MRSGANFEDSSPASSISRKSLALSIGQKQHIKETNRLKVAFIQS
jgi:hypothetical protein